MLNSKLNEVYPVEISYENYEDALQILDYIERGLLEDTQLNKQSCKLIITLYENSGFFNVKCSM